MSDLSTWSTQHRAWVDEFVLALRDAGASDGVIAAHLTGAHQRCGDGAQAPEEVLGTGRQHAASLGFEPLPAAEPRSLAPAVGAVASMVVLMLVGSYAVRDAVLDAGLRVNLGTALCWGGIVVLLGAYGVLVLRRLRAALSLPVVLVLHALAAALGAAGALLSLTGLPVLYRGSPVPVAVVVVVLVLGIAGLATRAALRVPVRPARPGGGPAQQAWAGRRERAARVLPYWIVPAAMAVDAVFTAVTGS